eukprot:2099874-Rhodomonas_salina.1
MEDDPIISCVVVFAEGGAGIAFMSSSKKAKEWLSMMYYYEILERAQVPECCCLFIFYAGKRNRSKVLQWFRDHSMFERIVPMDEIKSMALGLWYIRMQYKVWAGSVLHVPVKGDTVLKMAAILERECSQTTQGCIARTARLGEQRRVLLFVDFMNNLFENMRIESTEMTKGPPLIRRLGVVTCQNTSLGVPHIYGLNDTAIVLDAPTFSNVPPRVLIAAPPCAEEVEKGEKGGREGEGKGR